MNLKEKVRIVPDYPKQGIRFMDITTLFKDADAFKELVERMKRELDGIKVDAVVGPEARGFVLGATLAYSMGVGFVPARKPGKLPAEVGGEVAAVVFAMEHTMLGGIKNLDGYNVHTIIKF